MSQFPVITWFQYQIRFQQKSVFDSNLPKYRPPPSFFGLTIADHGRTGGVDTLDSLLLFHFLMWIDSIHWYLLSLSLGHIFADQLHQEAPDLPSRSWLGGNQVHTDYQHINRGCGSNRVSQVMLQFQTRVWRQANEIPFPSICVGLDTCKVHCCLISIRMIIKALFKAAMPRAKQRIQVFAKQHTAATCII